MWGDYNRKWMRNAGIFVTATNTYSGLLKRQCKIEWQAIIFTDLTTVCLFFIGRCILWYIKHYFALVYNSTGIISF